MTVTMNPNTFGVPTSRTTLPSLKRPSSLSQQQPPRDSQRLLRNGRIIANARTQPPCTSLPIAARASMGRSMVQADAPDVDSSIPDHENENDAPNGSSTNTNLKRFYNFEVTLRPSAHVLSPLTPSNGPRCDNVTATQEDTLEAPANLPSTLMALPSPADWTLDWSPTLSDSVYLDMALRSVAGSPLKPSTAIVRGSSYLPNHPSPVEYFVENALPEFSVATTKTRRPNGVICELHQVKQTKNRKQVAKAINRKLQSEKQVTAAI